MCSAADGAAYAPPTQTEEPAFVRASHSHSVRPHSHSHSHRCSPAPVSTAQATPQSTANKTIQAKAASVGDSCGPFSYATWTKTAAFCYLSFGGWDSLPRSSLAAIIYQLGHYRVRQPDPMRKGRRASSVGTRVCCRSSRAQIPFFSALLAIFWVAVSSRRLQLASCPDMELFSSAVNRGRSTFEFPHSRLSFP